MKTTRTLYKPTTAVLLALATWGAAPSRSVAQTSTPPAAGAQAAKPGQLELETWEAPDKSYSIGYPKGWEAKASAEGANAGGGGGAGASPVFTGPAEGGERPDAFQVVTGPATLPNAPSTPPPAPTPPANSRYPSRSTPAPAAQAANNPANKLRNWTKSLRDGLTQKGGDVKVLSENQATLGGAQGVRFVYDSKGTGGEATRTIHYVVEKGDRQYSVSFSFDPKRMSKIIPVEQAVSRSFKIGTPVPVAAAGTPGGAGAAETGADASKSPAAAGGGTPFESKPHNFRLTYPAGWAPAGNKHEGAALSLEKPASAGNEPQGIAVLSTPLPGGQHVSLQAMEGVLSQLIQTGLKNGKTQSTDAKLGGEPARRVSITGTRTSDGHEARAVMIFAVHGQSVVALVGGGPAEDEQAFNADFDHVAQSFSFLDGPPAASAAAASATPPKEKAPAPAPASTAKPVAPSEAPKPATPAPAAAADPNAPTFEIPEAGLTMGLPAGWTVRKAPAPGVPLMLMATPSKPGGRASTITVALERVDAGAGAKPVPAQLADEAVKAFKAAIASDAQVLETADPKFGTARARRVVVAAHRNLGNLDIRQILLCFYSSGGDQVVTITGESAAAEFDALKAAMDQVAGSIALKPPPLRRPQ